jgi:hypothetical protein
MKKFLLTLLMVMGLASSAEAQGYVQKKTNTISSGTAVSVTFDGLPVLGNTVVCAGFRNSTSGTTTINNGSGGVPTWTLRFQSDSTNGTRLFVWDGTADGSTNTQITVSTTAIASLSVICVELSNNFSYSTSSLAYGTTEGTATTPTIATSVVGDVVLAFTAKSSSSSTGSPAAPFSAIALDSSNGRYAGASVETSSIDSYFTSWSTSATVWTAGIGVWTNPDPPGGGGGGARCVIGSGIICDEDM